jgi:hypothetical protein
MKYIDNAGRRLDFLEREYSSMRFRDAHPGLARKWRTWKRVALHYHVLLFSTKAATPPPNMGVLRAQGF